ncbi:coiled-coil domain-containing protein 115 [Hypanus sabinus]|uniref:coiled-coil domain-containing protein 115 n=1 Tax=Hypanus sabinus TaxID=79690 RepID=UPI0028C3AD8C|nr:coiled-coil domain-containing protein 115 [Hypanus sabinus]
MMSGEDGQGPLCERLDEELLRYLEEMEQLDDRRERLQRLMEQGWLSLSKARYSMGTKWVSSLQYGSEMVPLARVDVSQKEDGHYDFRVERVDSGEQTGGTITEKHLEIEEIGPKEQEEAPLVRRRRKPEGGGEVCTPQASEEDRERPSRPGGPPLARDPMKWFGVLVPHSLRLAQASFKEVMELAAEVATLQSRISKTKSRYRDLLRQKQEPAGRLSL